MLSFGSLKRGSEAAEAEEPSRRKRSKDELIQALVAEFDAAVRREDEEEVLDALLDVLDSPVIRDEEEAPAVRKVQLLTLKTVGKLKQKKQDRDCLRYYEAAMALDPADVSLAFSVAQFGLSMSDVRLARSALERALQTDPTFWPALSVLLELTYSIGDRIGCIMAADRCLAVQPMNSRASLLKRFCLEGRAIALERKLLLQPPPAPRAASVVEVGVIVIKTFSWQAVLTAVTQAVCGDCRQPFRLDWVSASRVVRVSTPKKRFGETSVKVVPTSLFKGISSPLPSQPTAESTALDAGGGGASTLISRASSAARKHDHLLALMETFLPECPDDPSVEDRAGFAGEEGRDELDDDVGSSAVSSNEIVAVDAWLKSRGDGQWDALNLVDSLCEALCLWQFPWSDRMRKLTLQFIPVLSAWDVSARMYFLVLCELVVVSGSSGSNIKMARKLLEKFCFAFGQHLSEVNVWSLRVQRVKGQICQALEKTAEALKHYQALADMFPVAQFGKEDPTVVVLPHLRSKLSMGSIQRDIASLGDRARLIQGKAYVKEGRYQEAADLLAPLLLTQPGESSSFAVEPKKRASLLGKFLYKAVCSLDGRPGFPAVAIELVAQARGGSLSATALSQIRQVLTDLRETKIESWSVAERRSMQRQLHALIRMCIGKSHLNALLVNAWEALFFFVPRPLTVDGVVLIEKALLMVEEADACMVDDGMFLRLALKELLQGILSYSEDNEDDLVETWHVGLHHAIHCLYDVKMPLHRKEHGQSRSGRKKGAAMVTQRLMADAFDNIGEHLVDPDMSGLVRKIHSRFAELPEVFASRLELIARTLQNGSDSVAMDALLLELAKPDTDVLLALIPFPNVYKEIYSLQANHIIKYSKLLTNRSRMGLRIATARKWFESKQSEEPKRLFMLDLAVNPARFESWCALGMWYRSRLDHLLAIEHNHLSATASETRKKMTECRTGAMQASIMALHCTVDMDERETRANILAEMALLQLSASRLVEVSSAARLELLKSALEFACRAKSVYPDLWLAWYVSGLVQRKLRALPELYLADFAQAVKLQSHKQRGSQYMLHATRAKLYLSQGCTLDVLESFAYGSKSRSREGEEDQDQVVRDDIIQGLLAARSEDDAHHIDYLLIRLNLFEKVDESLKLLKTLFVPEESKFSAKTAGVLAIFKAPVRVLEGYGLPECQVRDRMSSKLLTLYIELLKQARNHHDVLELFLRLRRYEESGGSAFRDHLVACAHLLKDIVAESLEQPAIDDGNLAHDLVQAALELHKASRMLQLDDSGDFLKACLRRLDGHEGQEVDDQEDLVARAHTFLGFEEHLGPVQAKDSPNYSALRTKKKAKVEEVE